MAARGTDDLEAAFIGYIADAAGEASKRGPGRRPSRPQAETLGPVDLAGRRRTRRAGPASSLGRLLAYSRRETLEILRDPVRLAVRVRRLGWS